MTHKTVHDKKLKINLIFPDETLDAANRYAASLAEELATIHVPANQFRQRSDSQDFGPALQLLLSTTAATAVARGIAGWLTRNNVCVTMFTADGGVIIKGANGKDAARIAEALASISKKPKKKPR